MNTLESRCQFKNEPIISRFKNIYAALSEKGNDEGENEHNLL